MEEKSFYTFNTDWEPCEMPLFLWEAEYSGYSIGNCNFFVLQNNLGFMLEFYSITFPSNEKR